MASAPIEHGSFDPLDCFNEDLVWIVDRLVGRSGGKFGLITRHVQGEDARILAQTKEAPGSCDVLTGLALEAAVAIDPQRRRHDDDVCMRETAWSPTGGTKALAGDFRLLQLAFSPTQNVSVVASVGRADGSRSYGPLELATASRLYPVLSKYLRLWWLHRMERRRANSLSAALDLSDVGVLLLDRRTHLLFANLRAISILEREDGLGRNGDAIRATEPSTDWRLQLAIHQALQRNQSAAKMDEPVTGAPIITLLRANHRRALLTTVMSVRDAAVDVRDAAAILYVFDPEQDLERILEPVCRIYKLTGAEARLVHHLMSGRRISEAAERMQVRPDTARAYLKQVFAKTATNRQADLIRLMFASMLRTSASVDLTLLPGSTKDSHC